MAKILKVVGVAGLAVVMLFAMLALWAVAQYG